MILRGQCGIIGAALLTITGLVSIGWILWIQPMLASADTIEAPLPPTTVTTLETPDFVKGTPVRLAIERLKIDLAVTPGGYDNSAGAWRLDETRVLVNSWPTGGTLDTSPEAQPLLIYGHNYPSILGKTKDLVVGDRLTIIFSDSRRIDLHYLRDAIYPPADITILSYDGPEPLLLMTCDGTWDESRRVMFFGLPNQEDKE